MLKMRYANYPKDYFMGMLPSSQYGSVAILPAINSSHEPTSVAFGTDFRLGQYATLTNPSGSTSVEISADMIKMRYANYPKDYFLGVLPASQYGSVAILPSSYMGSQPSYSVVAAVSSTMDTTFIS